jgi:hypothetical protein
MRTQKEIEEEIQRITSKTGKSWSTKAYIKALDWVLEESSTLRGKWSEDDIRRAFVAGASWWEFDQTSATMWTDDRSRAETEATKRYGDQS